MAQKKLRYHMKIYSCINFYYCMVLIYFIKVRGSTHKQNHYWFKSTPLMKKSMAKSSFRGEDICQRRPSGTFPTNVIHFLLDEKTYLPNSIAHCRPMPEWHSLIH